MPIERILFGGNEIETLAERLRPGLRAIIVRINPSPVSVLAGHYYQGQLGKRPWHRLETYGILHSLPPGKEDDAAFAQDFGFAERFSVECENDGEAIVQASGVLERRPRMVAVEVWDGARLVQKLGRGPS